MAARPWTDEEDQRLRDLYAAETPVRKIATELGRPHSTVALRAKKLGLASKRTDTVAATTTRVVDAKARRSAAALAELEILELAQARTLKALRGDEKWSTILRGELGVEDVQRLDTIPPRDMREESSARSAMSTTISKLSVEDNGVTEGVAMIDRLADALGIPQPGEAS